MNFITLNQSQYNEAAPLIYDCDGNFNKGVTVNAAIQMPSYVICFDEYQDAVSFCALLNLSLGKITKNYWGKD